jgi:hypothetical protein
MSQSTVLSLLQSAQQQDGSGNNNSDEQFEGGEEGRHPDLIGAAASTPETYVLAPLATLMTLFPSQVA